MKIALFSPLNPIKSGISDYTEGLLPDLAKHADIYLIVDPGYKPTNRSLLKNVNMLPYDPKTFQPEDYDEIIYHMGNSYAPHKYIYEALKKFPGVVVLHDLILQGFYAEKFFADKKLNELKSIQRKYYGEKGEIIAEHIAHRLPVPIWEAEKGLDFPMNEEIVEHAKALIVHSEFVRSRITASRDLPVTVIPHHGHHLKEYDVAAVRRELGIAPDETLICSAGFINRNKRFHIIIPAIRELNLSNMKYVIAGKDGANILKDLLDDQPENFITMDYLPVESMNRLIRASDICINLRYPTMGESSGSLLRMLGYGKPVLVSNVGSYMEIPDECVFKVVPDIHEKDMVKHAVGALVGDRDFRLSMGRQAVDYVKNECSIKKCAREYIRFLESL